MNSWKDFARFALCSAVVVGAMLCAVAAHATDASHLPVERVAEVKTAPGAPLKPFLEDVGTTLRAFSNLTGFEACGAIATDGTHYGIVITTSKSHLGCVVHHDMLPAGMHDMGVTIHSHGQEGKSFAVNKADRALTGRTDDGRMTFVAGQDVHHFSPTDYAGGAGYLATPEGVIYQDGKGTERAL